MPCVWCRRQVKCYPDRYTVAYSMSKVLPRQIYSGIQHEREIYHKKTKLNRRIVTGWLLLAQVFWLPISTTGSHTSGNWHYEVILKLSPSSSQFDLISDFTFNIVQKQNPFKSESHWHEKGSFGYWLHSKQTISKQHHCQIMAVTYHANKPTANHTAAVAKVSKWQAWVPKAERGWGTVDMSFPCVL